MNQSEAWYQWPLTLHIIFHHNTHMEVTDFHHSTSLFIAQVKTEGIIQIDFEFQEVKFWRLSCVLTLNVDVLYMIR